MIDYVPPSPLQEKLRWDILNTAIKHKISIQLGNGCYYYQNIPIFYEDNKVHMTFQSEQELNWFILKHVHL